MMRNTASVHVSVSAQPDDKYSPKKHESHGNFCAKIKRNQSSIVLSVIILNLFFAFVWLLSDSFEGCDCEHDNDWHRNDGNGTKRNAAEKWMPEKVSDREINATYRFLTSHYKEFYTNPTYLRDIHRDLPPEIDLDSVHWQFNMQISNYGMYLESEGGALVDKLVHSMAYSPIINMEQDDLSGTELKLIATFADGTVALMKPQRMKRDEEVNPNLFVFSEYERHHAEIAGYHLDRILGFNHVPPCTGRLLNVSKDIMPFIDDQFALTIHRSPAGNLCFYGQCMYFCDIHHPYCGDPDTVEVSVCVYLPLRWWPSWPVISPWRRSYSKSSLADWQLKQHNASYCHKLVDREGMYVTGRRLLDVIDESIFDFLTGNIDRHHYEYWNDFGDNSSLIIFDNGRGFGRYREDDFSIIPALYQCCAIRKSTYDKLMHLRDGKVKLSHLMRWHMRKDPLAKRAPVLAEQHLEALDRRVNLTLEIVHKDCIINKRLKFEEVILDDKL